MTAATLVVNDLVYEVRVSSGDDLRAATVTVTLNGRFEWSCAVSGWRGVSLGASGPVSYLWSARELVVLPRSADIELRKISFDEDLLFTFGVDYGWVAVCETSVRRIVGYVETARVEFGEVIETARWEGEILLIQDVAAGEHALRVEGDRLVD